MGRGGGEISDLCQKNRKRLFAVLGIALITPLFFLQLLGAMFVIFFRIIHLA